MEKEDSLSFFVGSFAALAISLSLMWAIFQWGFIKGRESNVKMIMSASRSLNNCTAVLRGGE